MRRIIGFLALVLGSVGLAACLAGLIAVWVYRTPLLQSSLEVVEAADDGLKDVEDYAKRADEVVAKVKEVVDPVAQKIIELADKAKSTRPEVEMELKRVEEELAERFRQVDALVQASETVVGILNKTARLTSSLPGARGTAGDAPAGNLDGSGEVVARLAEGLKTLRTALAKVREDKQAQKEVVDTVIRVARDVDKELTTLHDKLELVRQRAAAYRAEAAELRTHVPCWITWGAAIGSLLLAWIGLGQFSLLRRGWGLLGKHSLM